MDHEFYYYLDYPRIFRLQAFTSAKTACLNQNTPLPLYFSKIGLTSKGTMNLSNKNFYSTSLFRHYLSAGTVQLFAAVNGAADI